MYEQAINKILKDLKSHRRACKATGEEFEISERAIEFYRTLKVPPPTWAPIPRRNRRMAATNFNRFHRRKCDATGESVISQYAQTNPFIIYKNEYWWSDKWDPMSYGQAYDFARPFFDQFNNLRRVVPRAAINRDSNNQNSDYVIGGSSMKDCYFVFGGISGENCLYMDVIVNDKNCMDCAYARESEYCYEIARENLMFAPAGTGSRDIIDCWGLSKAERSCELLRIYDSYDIKYSSHLKNSLDVEYSDDCYNVEHCFGCVGLRFRKYCVFNKQYTESAYNELVDRIKTKMLEAGEYGEFFPLGISPVPYNDSYAWFAREQQGLWDTEEATSHGAWAEAPEASTVSATIDAKDLPDHINDVKDELIGKVIKSAGDGRPYTIIKPELALYREWHLPVPKENYHERAARRARELRSWRPFTRVCAQCGESTYTSVRPDYPGKLVCNPCYQKQVG